jgi:hypothetical protein
MLPPAVSTESNSESGESSDFPLHPFFFFLSRVFCHPQKNN